MLVFINTSLRLVAVSIPFIRRLVALSVVLLRGLRSVTGLDHLDGLLVGRTNTLELRSVAADIRVVDFGELEEVDADFLLRRVAVEVEAAERTSCVEVRLGERALLLLTTSSRRIVGCVSSDREFRSGSAVRTTSCC